MSTKVGIIIGTNRPRAMTGEMALYYQQKLSSLGMEPFLIDLRELPADFVFTALYDYRGQHPEYGFFQEQIDTCEKFIIIAPEYNGSFPGVLKAFIDGLRYPDSFRDKKVAFVGLSAGVLGNAVGLAHLSDIMSYMGANVLGLRIKLGEIGKYFKNQQLENPIYEKLIDEQISKFLNF